MAQSTRSLFEDAAHACADAVRRESRECFDHLATMVALCRIDSPRPEGMEEHISAVESELREEISRGEIVPSLHVDKEPMTRAAQEQREAALVAEGFLSGADLDRLERNLCASISSAGLGRVPVMIHNSDLGSLIAETRHHRESPSTASELERWKSCFICVQCGRCSADEDGCCASCGGDCLIFEDGKLVRPLELAEPVLGITSDGYHTFDELYDHRITLFLALCDQIRNHAPDFVWRSKLHSDGTSIDGWFVAGIGESAGEQITYHLPLSRWEEAGFLTEFERAPNFDGHTSADVLHRLRRFYGGK